VLRCVVSYGVVSYGVVSSLCVVVVVVCCRGCCVCCVLASHQEGRSQEGEIWFVVELCRFVA
jgi:hypothetical protein